MQGSSSRRRNQPAAEASDSDSQQAGLVYGTYQSGPWGPGVALPWQMPDVQAPTYGLQDQNQHVEQQNDSAYYAPAASTHAGFSAGYPVYAPTLSGEPAQTASGAQQSAYGAYAAQETQGHVLARPSRHSHRGPGQSLPPQHHHSLRRRQHGGRVSSQPELPLRRTTTQSSTTSTIGSFMRRTTGGSKNSNPGREGRVQEYIPCYEDLPWEKVESYLARLWPGATFPHEFYSDCWVFWVPSPGLSEDDVTDIMKLRDQKAGARRERRPKTPE